MTACGVTSLHLGLCAMSHSYGSVDRRTGGWGGGGWVVPLLGVRTARSISCWGWQQSSQVLGMLGL